MGDEGDRWVLVFGALFCHEVYHDAFYVGDATQGLVESEVLLLREDQVD